MIREESAQLVRAGAFVMASLAVLLVGIVLLGRSQTLFAHRVHLHAAFANTSGLVAGAPVRLGGVDVGIVESIRFDPDLHEKRVHVSLAVDRRYLDRIRSDSIARLSSKGLLGDMIINITVGSAESAPLADGATLRAESSEGLTEVIGSLQDGIGQIRALSSTVQERLSAVLTDQLGRDIGRIAHATADVVENVRSGDGLAHALVYEPRLARNADRTLADARLTVENANQAIERVDRMLGDVEHGSGTLHGLIYRDDAAKLIAELTRSAGEVEQLLGAVRDGHGLLHELIYDQRRGELLANLASLSATLKHVADDVQAGKGTVGALLEDPSVYEDLKTILGSVKRNALLKAIIRSTIKRDNLRALPSP